MPYLVAILIGLVIGWLRGGRLSRLAQLRLRWLWIVLLALVIQLLIFPIFSESALLPYATTPLHLLSYAILIAWLAVNLRTAPMGVLLLGALSNFTVLASNGGRMPVSATALQQAGLARTAGGLLETEAVANVTLMGPSTHLNFLADWLYMPKWIPFSGMKPNG
jgi:hypothetical protein